MIRVGSLCTGIGGIDLGLERAGMEIVYQVEIDDYCNKVLEKHWPGVQRYRDIRKLDASETPAVDLLVGGYPCQPFSFAGRRAGKSDDRHLWPEFIRLLRAWRIMGKLPTWCLFENVAGHITMGLDDVLSDLEGVGYTRWPLIIPACAVDAKHRRDRVWIIAYAGGEQHQGRRAEERGQACTELSSPNATSPRFTDNRGGKAHAKGRRRGAFDCGGWRAGEYAVWSPEPAVGRVADGVPRRVDRLRALGNAVVPQVAYEIGRAITAAALMAAQEGV